MSYKKKIEDYHLDQEGVFKLIPIGFLLIYMLVFLVLGNVVQSQDTCDVLSRACQEKWWILSVFFDSCPVHLQHTVLAPFEIIFGMTSNCPDNI